MKKKKDLEAKKESEAPVTIGFMREFRAEVMSRFSEVDARFKQMDGKIEQAVAEMKTMNHQTMLLVEEQNLRNKQAYDGYVLTYGAIQDLRNRIKPECME